MDPLSDSLINAAQSLLLEFLSATEHPESDQIQARISGMAAIVAEEFGLGSLSEAACYLSLPYNKGWLLPERITSEFSPVMLRILDGLKKIDGLNTSRTRIHADKFIQLLLSISEDVRIILIKTGERLFALRNIHSLPPDEQLRMAHEARDLYAPIAHRLGLYLIKQEFEEVALKYQQPDVFGTILRKLDESKSNREEYINRFIEPLRNELVAKGYRCDIKGRTKAIPSIWRKMMVQGVDFEEVYDLFAIRIILDNPSDNEKADCWQIYSIVTDIYQPNPQRLRDWISSPKPNGYESLHTTVIGPEGRWVEVQIRTRRMDEIAEKGHAAHWRYKENNLDVEGTAWLSEIREALGTSLGTRNADEVRAKTELYSDQIYIFTPQGDLLKLRSGSTVLDFAFAVHSEVGSKCTGARVNGQIVPIRQRLVNGDQVEVLTAAQQRPNLNWLNIAITSKARARIKRFLKEAEFNKADEGKEILNRKLEQWRIKDDVSTIQKIVNWLNLKDALNLYQAVAENRVDMASLKEFLREKAPSEILREKAAPVRKISAFAKTVSQQEDYLIIDNALDRVDYRMAKCCNPIYGDEVFGFVTVKDGTKIHRINCPNAKQMIERYPYRIVKVRWSESHGETASFTVNILISGMDDISVVNEISKQLSSDPKLILRAMNIVAREALFEGTYTLNVQDKVHLDSIINRLRKIKGIISVRRSDDYRL